MKFAWEGNKRGNYAFGVTVEYSHDQKCVVFQFEVFLGNVIVAIQWGQ